MLIETAAELHDANMELLQKISKYERALYAKGIDPRKL
jgi:hypothetical protein